MVLNGAELSWKEVQLLYRDQAGTEDTNRSVAFDSKNRFYLESGKLRFEYDGLCYDVDSAIFSRILSQDTFPKFISKER